MNACATRYYGIEFINIGHVEITAQEFRWGDRGFSGSPIAPDISLGVYAFPKSDFDVNGAWRMPEQATLTWTPAGASQITRVFDIRKHVKNPNSFKSRFTWELDGANIRIFLTPALLDDPLKKTLIVESTDESGAH